MTLQYLAGQRLTADALQRAVPDRVMQTNDQTRTSSITLVNSEIVITVDGLLKIELDIRWQSGGGGIRWAWASTGSASVIARSITARGDNATGGVDDITTMTLRRTTTFTSVVTAAHDTTSGLQAGMETLLVEGSGTATFQFAQDTSNAAATTLFAASYALITRLGS